MHDDNGTVLTGNDNTTSGSEVIDTNFRIPRPLAPGVYYVSVRSADRMATGDYTLHAEADDHGQSFDTATTLLLGDSAAGRIDPGYDRDVFKLDLSGTSGTTDVWIYTTGELNTQGWLYDSNGTCSYQIMTVTSWAGSTVSISGGIYQVAFTTSRSEAGPGLSGLTRCTRRR